MDKVWLLRQLFTIYKGYRYSQTASIYHVKHDKAIPNTYINVLDKTDYIARGIMTPAILSSACYIVTFKVDNTQVVCHVVDANQHAMKMLSKICQILHMYVYFLNRLASERKTVNTFIVLSTSKKVFKHDTYNGSNPLGADSVNSGLTINEQIIVYRKEEVFKVLLHELCHLYQVDYYDSKNLQIEIPSIPVKSKLPIRLNESYNDAVTILLYVFFHLVQKHNHKFTNFEALRKEYILSLDARVQYLIKIASNVLRYYGYRKVTDGFTISENTHVFSYYIAKAAVLHNWLAFMKFMGNSIVISNDFKKIEAYQRVFVIEAMSEPVFNNALNAHLKKFVNLKGMSLNMVDINL